MKIEQKENHIIVQDEKNDVKGFAHYLSNPGYRHLKDKNVIIDISEYGNLKLDELLAFLKLSNDHRGKSLSLVFVNDTINIEHVPPELIVVPSVQEAEDVIQMEDIERDLGAF